jgi:hypothetical protein
LGYCEKNKVVMPDGGAKILTDVKNLITWLIGRPDRPPRRGLQARRVAGRGVLHKERVPAVMLQISRRGHGTNVKNRG